MSLRSSDHGLPNDGSSGNSSSSNGPSSNPAQGGNSQQNIEHKLQSLGYCQPKPELRALTLEASRRELRKQTSQARMELRFHSWWTESLMAVAVVLLTLGLPLLEQSEPQRLKAPPGHAYLDQLKEAVGSTSLGFVGTKTQISNRPPTRAFGRSRTPELDS